MIAGGGTEEARHWLIAIRRIRQVIATELAECSFLDVQIARSCSYDFCWESLSPRAFVGVFSQYTSRSNCSGIESTDFRLNAIRLQLEPEISRPCDCRIPASYSSPANIISTFHTARRCRSEDALRFRFHLHWRIEAAACTTIMTGNPITAGTLKLRSHPHSQGTDG